MAIGTATATLIDTTPARVFGEPPVPVVPSSFETPSRKPSAAQSLENGVTAIESFSRNTAVDPNTTGHRVDGSKAGFTQSILMLRTMREGMTVHHAERQSRAKEASTFFGKETFAVLTEKGTADVGDVKVLEDILESWDAAKVKTRIDALETGDPDDKALAQQLKTRVRVAHARLDPLIKSMVKEIKAVGDNEAKLATDSYQTYPDMPALKKAAFDDALQAAAVKHGIHLEVRRPHTNLIGGRDVPVDITGEQTRVTAFYNDVGRSPFGGQLDL